jgi:hypothetical protein
VSQVYGQRRGGEERRRKQPRIFQSHFDGDTMSEKEVAIYRKAGSRQALRHDAAAEWV